MLAMSSPWQHTLREQRYGQSMQGTGTRPKASAQAVWYDMYQYLYGSKALKEGAEHRWQRALILGSGQRHACPDPECGLMPPNGHLSAFTLTSQHIVNYCMLPAAAKQRKNPNRAD